MDVKYILPGALVLAAAFSRLIPHAPNFTAMTAMALFAGFAFGHLGWALLMPLLSLVLTDLILGFHVTMLPVYVGFLTITVFSYLFLKNRKLRWMPVAGLLAGLWFWTISNLGVWYYMDLYTKNAAGLMQCFISALPFLETQLAGDVLYTVVIFSLYALFSRVLSVKTYSSI